MHQRVPMALPPLGLPPIEKGRPVAGRPFCFVEKCIVIGQNASPRWVGWILSIRNSAAENRFEFEWAMISGERYEGASSL